MKKGTVKIGVTDVTKNIETANHAAIVENKKASQKELSTTGTRYNRHVRAERHNPGSNKANKSFASSGRRNRKMFAKYLQIPIAGEKYTEVRMQGKTFIALCAETIPLTLTGKVVKSTPVFIHEPIEIIQSQSEKGGTYDITKGEYHHKTESELRQKEYTTTVPYFTREDLNSIKIIIPSVKATIRQKKAIKTFLANPTEDFEVIIKLRNPNFKGYKTVKVVRDIEKVIGKPKENTGTGKKVHAPVNNSKRSNGWEHPIKEKVAKKEREKTPTFVETVIDIIRKRRITVQTPELKTTLTYRGHTVELTMPSITYSPRVKTEAQAIGAATKHAEMQLAKLIELQKTEIDKVRKEEVQFGKKAGSIEPKLITFNS